MPVDLHNNPSHWNVGVRLDVDKLPLKRTFHNGWHTGGVDTDLWRPEFPWGNTTVINQEEQGYPTHFDALPSGFKPVSVEHNQLVIRCAKTADADREHVNNQAYSSGLLTTQNLHTHRQGLIQIRCKIPKGQGAFPAFWSLIDFAFGSWPDHLHGKTLPEIDVMENLGHTGRVLYQTVHSNTDMRLAGYKDSGSAQKQLIVEPGQQPDYSDGYHTYATLWTTDYLYWLIDGVITFKVPTPDDINYGDFTDRFMLVNLAFNSGWAREQPQYDTKYQPFPVPEFPLEYWITSIKSYDWTDTETLCECCNQTLPKDERAEEAKRVKPAPVIGEPVSVEDIVDESEDTVDDTGGLVERHGRIPVLGNRVEHTQLHLLEWPSIPDAEKINIYRDGEWYDTLSGGATDYTVQQSGVYRIEGLKARLDGSTIWFGKSNRVNIDVDIEL